MMKVPPTNTGETLEFKLSYGWFTVGRASMRTLDQYEVIDGTNHIKLEIQGKTAGFLGAFSKVDDRWGATLREDNFLPIYSYRFLREGSYKKDERVYFERDSMMIRVEEYDVKKKHHRAPKYFEFKQDTLLDMLGGLMWARSIDYKKLNKGDTLALDAFFDKEFFDFKVVYDGVENIKTKVGRINCFKLVPVMPDTKLFRGENSVTLWISADANRLPLMAKAAMFFGTGYCELTSYKNVKSGIDFQ